MQRQKKKTLDGQVTFYFIFHVSMRRDGGWDNLQGVTLSYVFSLGSHLHTHLTVLESRLYHTGATLPQRELCCTGRLAAVRHGLQGGATWERRDSQHSWHGASPAHMGKAGFLQRGMPCVFCWIIYTLQPAHCQKNSCECNIKTHIWK